MEYGVDLGMLHGICHFTVQFAKVNETVCYSKRQVSMLVYITNRKLVHVKI